MVPEINYKHKYGSSNVFKNLGLNKKESHQKYVVRDDPKDIEDLKEILETVLKKTSNHDLKIGLKIMLILISHERKDVEAYALGNLTSLNQDSNLDGIIIKELRSLINNKDPEVQKCAEESLELVLNRSEMLDAVEVIPKLSTQLKNRFKSKFEQHFKSLQIQFPVIPTLNSFELSLNTPKFEVTFNPSVSKDGTETRILTKILTRITQFYNVLNYLVYKYRPKISNFKPEIKLRRNLTIRYNMLNYSIYKNSFLSKINEVIPILDDLNVLVEERGVLPLSQLAKLESKQHKNPLIELATVYTNTFLEKGHLRRLESFLDDDDHSTRMIGADALTRVADILINLKNKSTINGLEGQ